MAVENWYRCGKCGKIMPRQSDKAWIKSYCDNTGQDVRIMKMAKGWNGKKMSHKGTGNQPVRKGRIKPAPKPAKKGGKTC